MNELRDRVALVTGASRGIGVYIAEALAMRGCHLILVARNAQALGEHAQRLSKKYGSHVYVQVADLGRSDGAEYLYESLMRDHPRIDILINNAAMFEEGYFPQTELAVLDAHLTVNLRSLVALTRLLLPGMMARDIGHVVNISSLAGLGGVAHGELYSCTKHAVVGFTRALRGTLKIRSSKVSASCICPGFISKTGMYVRIKEASGQTAPAVMGTSPPEAVARAVVFAILRDRGEVVVNPTPVRLGLAVQMIFPRLGEWLSRVLGLHRFYDRAVKIEQNSKRSSRSEDS